MRDCNWKARRNELELIWIGINKENLKDWFECEEQFEYVKMVATMFNAQEIMGIEGGFSEQRFTY